MHDARFTIHEKGKVIEHSVSCILYLASLFHRLYKAEITIPPAIYNVYISAIVICKNKEAFVEKVHLHSSLIRVHWFKLEPFIFYNPAHLCSSCSLCFCG